MSDLAEPIIARTTKWYHKRRLLMIAMLIGMGLWFLYDWKFAYPEKKAKYDEYYPVYAQLKSEGKETEWFELARSKGWPEKVDTKDWDWKIKEQLVYGIVVSLIGLGVAGSYLKNKGRELRADATSFTPPGGPQIPYASVHRLDKRKWPTKGLAYIGYKTESGAERTAVLDCLVFEEDKAEAIMKRLTENFKGELIELEAPAPSPVEPPAEPTEKESATS